MKATRRPHNFIDLTGKTFGRWTVEGRAPQPPGAQARWKCRCTCGSRQVVRSQDLRSGQSTQCRTCAFSGPDISGMNFGKWTVRGRAEGGAQGAHWWVECECGTERVLAASTLRNGESTKCKKCSHAHRSPDEELRYYTMHVRVRTRLGKASDHPCALCGGRARDWAYLHNAGTAERWESISSWRGKQAVVPFGTSLEHYAPMCRSCHYKYDNLKETP